MPVYPIPSQTPSFVSLVNNPMWVVAAPSSYSASTGYYVNLKFLPYVSSTEFFSSNINIYPSVYEGNAVFDCHNVIKNRVTYSTLPLTGTTGVYAMSDPLYKYKVFAYDYTGSTITNTNTMFFYGFGLLGGKNQDESEFNYTEYTASGGGLFLSPWVGSRTVRMGDTAVLSWLHKFYGSKYILAIAIDVYCGDGSIKNYSYYNNIYANITAIETFSCGPREIDKLIWMTGYTVVPTANETNILSSNNATKYVIKGIDISENNVTEEIEFIIDYYCPLIEDVQLMWLNKYGSYDTYTFYREFRKNLSITKDTYIQNNYEMINGIMGTPIWNRGETVLSMDVREEFMVKSKILTNDMSKNLAKIFESPEVFWIQKGDLMDDTILYYDPTPQTTTVQIPQCIAIPVIINEESIEVKNNENRPDRAIYSFKFYKSNKNITING